MNASSERLRASTPDRKILRNPQPLTTAYIKAQANKDFAPIRKANPEIQEELSEEKTNAFVDEHVMGYRVNGVDVLLISQDYKALDGQLKSIPRAFLSSSRTRKVGIEYFLPELRRNAKRLPLIGPRFIRERENTARFEFSSQIEEQAQHVNKPIFSADIADRASYEMTYTLAPFIPILASLGLLGSAGFDAFNLLYKSIFEPNILQLVQSSVPAVAGIMAKLIFPAYLQFNGNKHIQDESQKKGFFDPNDLNKRRQKFGFNLEDARRVFIAAGIQQITKDLHIQEPIEDAQRPQVVLFYPKAHVIRIADYLEQPHKIKRLSYRLIPGIKEKTREYVWDPEDKRSKKFGGWRRIANKRIPLFA